MDLKDKIQFETYAIFDLETTGLPQHNFNKVNIIEFCVSSISRKDLLNTNKDELPRIINKLSLIFNARMLIHPNASKVTGLDNYMLEYENDFDENAAAMIIGFFKHLRGPICLIAHNGNVFDFPILKKSFTKLNMSLPDNIYCVDSYKAIPFIDYMKTQAEENEKEIKAEQENLLNLEEELFRKLPEHLIDRYEIVSELTKKEKVENDFQKLNETTPKRRISREHIVSNHSKASRSDLLSDFKDTPPASPKKSSKSCTEKSKAKKQLFESSLKENDTPQKEKKKVKIPRSPKGHYTLGGIFKRIFYEPKKSHQAEADVAMLQKIIIHYGKDFVDYSEENSMPFSDV